MLKKLVPVVRRGGKIELAKLVAAVAGGKISKSAKALIAARGSIAFVRSRGTTVTTFWNDGTELDLSFPSFTLQIPTRIAGTARLVEDGVILRFDPAHSIHAKKFFFKVRLEGVEITSKRVFVDVEGASFDQQYDLI